jgi:hypothetical protein
MTRPAELRRSEDAEAGARYQDYEVGSRTGELKFVLDPAFVDEYIDVTGIDQSLYHVAGRSVVPPQILTLYLMATLHRRYVPRAGIVMAGLTLAMHAPIWRDGPISIVSEGVILSKGERGARRFITWQAAYRSDDGRCLATIDNTFVVPE